MPWLCIWVVKKKKKTVMWRRQCDGGVSAPPLMRVGGRGECIHAIARRIVVGRVGREERRRKNRLFGKRSARPPFLIPRSTTRRASSRCAIFFAAE